MHTANWKRSTDSVRIAGSVRARGGRCCLRSVRAIWMAVLLLSLPAMAAAQQIAIVEYPLRTAGGGLVGITTGPDGALWFTDDKFGFIERITTAGVITEYPMPKANDLPSSITTGPDGALWFTEFDNNKIGEAVFVTADLSVSPASGVFRSSLTFAGSAFAPNESVQIYVNGVGSRVLASAVADAGGAFTATALAPQSPYGARSFVGVGQSSGKLGAANFSVTPRLILNPNSGTAGSSVAAQGFGFGPHESVDIYGYNSRAILGIAETTVEGTFAGSKALTFTVPTGAPPGVNKVLGKGRSTGAIGVGYFTVE